MHSRSHGGGWWAVGGGRVKSEISMPSLGFAGGRGVAAQCTLSEGF